MFFFLFLKFNNGNFSSFFFCWPVLFLSMADIFFVFSFFSTIKACFTSRTCSFARSAFFFLKPLLDFLRSVDDVSW